MAAESAIQVLKICEKTATGCEHMGFVPTHENLLVQTAPVVALDPSNVVKGQIIATKKGDEAQLQLAPAAVTALNAVKNSEGDPTLVFAVGHQVVMKGKVSAHLQGDAITVTTYQGFDVPGKIVWLREMIAPVKNPSPVEVAQAPSSSGINMTSLGIGCLIVFVVMFILQRFGGRRSQ